MRKEKVRELVKAFPDDVDVDALMERLDLLRKLEAAEKECAAGGGIPNEDVEQRLAKWLE